MKTKLKRITSLLLALTMMLTTFFFASFSTSAAVNEQSVVTMALWADPNGVMTASDQPLVTTDDGKSTVSKLGLVQAHTITSSSSAEYYLFLPTAADLNALTLYYTASSLTVNGTAVISGEPTNVFAGSSYNTRFTVKLGNSSYSLYVVKSDLVGTVYINTASGSMKTINASSDHSAAETGSIMVINANGGVDYNGVLDKIGGHGNGTWGTTNDKNSYNIKLGTSASLLGLSKGKKYALLNGGTDNLVSMLKNRVTYDFADYIGVKYQSGVQPVDLYCEGHYMGSYQLVDKPQIKSSRVDIIDAYENLEIANGTTDPTTGVFTPANLEGTTVSHRIASTGTNTTLTDALKNSFAQAIGNYHYSPNLTSPSDVTGGYIFELEISNRWVEENTGFCAYNRQGWTMAKSCDYMTQEMTKYCYDLLYALGSSVYNNGVVPTKETKGSYKVKGTLGFGTTTVSVTNPAPAAQYQGLKWSDLLDANSAVLYYWTQEYFKNMDSSTSSTYFYKDSDLVDGMIYAGPVWDMDNSIGYNTSGSRWGSSWTDAEGWYTKNTRIYRFQSNDSTTTYSDKDTNPVPLSFYGALATNCTDFWEMCENYWYSTIQPATQVLLGNAEESGRLHSMDWYTNEIQYTGTMNFVRFNGYSTAAYNKASVQSSFENWFTIRNAWLNKNIETRSLANATVNSIAKQNYTGYPITPDINVTYKTANATIDLVEGSDYELEYKDNVNIGTATVTIKGLGRYAGSSKELTFQIVPGTIADGTLSIPEFTYADVTVSSTIADTSGRPIESGVTYQWYRNNIAISGATESTYTVTADDVGATLTVRAFGNSVIFNGSLTSNECIVKEGTKPDGMRKTIASWNYDYTADSALLANADATDATYYYTATSGENQSVSSLTASVDAVNSAAIKWSDSTDLYTNVESTTVSDRTPVMGTSKKNNVAWGEYPYFETETSTAGYENIKFSARLGGTNQAPRDWKLQYSLDGINYIDIEGAAYSIANNKTMELAFDNIQLPSDCDNRVKLYIRMLVSSEFRISQKTTVVDAEPLGIVGSTSGDAAVNNVVVTGETIAIITSLYEPTIATADGSELYSDNLVEIRDNNGGASVYYTVTANGVTTDPILYTEPFSPFNSETAKRGDTVTVTAYSQFDEVVSDSVSATFTYAGTNIVSFKYDDYSDNVVSGKVYSNGGVYNESAYMTAYADGTSQYVPLYNPSKSAYSVSPDDGLKWTADSGFTFKISTAGYTDVAISCDAYASATSGPNSTTLLYSLDGVNFTAVNNDKILAKNGALEQYYYNFLLPNACSNQSVVYIKLATTQNLTSSGTALHNQDSKGDLYINNIIFSGNDNGEYKMPYTNKTTDYFGKNGTVKYYYPGSENISMQYTVTDASGRIVMNGTYPQTGIQLSAAPGFNPTVSEPYTISIWAGDDEDQSLINTRTYYYKGVTIAEFDYNSTTFPLHINEDATVLSALNGEGTLSMYPNGTTAATLERNGTYGVRVSKPVDEPFAATKNLDNPDGNGYWLITTSTIGYQNISLNADQLSSNKGPRDWGVAYSLDGINYTYVENSNVRAISNDNVTSAVETYGNLQLPAACADQETLYIKIFINGGEAVNGNELDDTLTIDKGNTGIDKLEISGTPMPKAAVFTLKATVLETVSATEGSLPLAGITVTVNGEDYTTDENGCISIEANEGTTITAVFANGKFSRTVTATVSDGAVLNVPLMMLDLNNDGYINNRDYVLIMRLTDSSKKNLYDEIYTNFVNINSNDFVYSA